MKKTFFPFSRSVSILAIASISTLSSFSDTAQAGQRKFAYTYEATTSPKGSIEFENWVTWRHRNNGAGRQDRFDFRHELEFGVTDRLQIGLYLADWTYNDRDPDKKARYQHSGVEVIYNLTNPTTDFLGSGLYGELLVGDDVVKLEGKILLQKNFGPLIVAYNAVVESEWEGEDLEERTGELKQTMGVSYELNQYLSLGAEAVYEVEFEDWKEAGDSVVYVGPNLSARAGKFFATLAGLFQVTGIDEEPEVQTRLIFGFDF